MNKSLKQFSISIQTIPVSQIIQIVYIFKFNYTTYHTIHDTNIICV